jgi:phosphohistidine phosphatase
MNIYIVRHGIAVDIGEQGVEDDEGRMLSAEGQRKTARVAAGLKALDCRPARIVSSPLLRAVETAEILARALRPAAPLEQLALLEPDEPPRDAVAWLAEQADEDIMLVGHLPHAAEFAALLLGVRGSGGLLFKKAAACCIACDHPARAGEGALVWHLPPAVSMSIAAE